MESLTATNALWIKLFAGPKGKCEKQVTENVHAKINAQLRLVEKKEDAYGIKKHAKQNVHAAFLVPTFCVLLDLDVSMTQKNAPQNVVCLICLLVLKLF